MTHLDSAIPMRNRRELSPYTDKNFERYSIAPDVIKLAATTRSLINI